MRWEARKLEGDACKNQYVRRVNDSTEISREGGDETRNWKKWSTLKIVYYNN